MALLSALSRSVAGVAAPSNASRVQGRVVASARFSAAANVAARQACFRPTTTASVSAVRASRVPAVASRLRAISSDSATAVVEGSGDDEDDLKGLVDNKVGALYADVDVDDLFGPDDDEDDEDDAPAPAPRAAVPDLSGANPDAMHVDNFPLSEITKAALKKRGLSNSVLDEYER